MKLFIVKINPFTSFCSILTILLWASCNQQEAGKSNKLILSEDFRNYWYAGKAEVSSYNLIQSRYGEDRAGKAMMIFVTEDFSISKQVKLDDPATAGTDKASVLKLNMTKNFITGIYPYSMMLSAFTPVEVHQVPHTLKLTMTAQEWCGQVFTQVNLRHKNYVIAGHSYFEKEADETLNLKVAWLEDELWNRIRLSPETLPVGEVDMIPGLFFSRLNHVGLDIEKAICTKEETPDEVTYTVTYPSHQRSLAIGFEKAFPHRIKGWVEKQEQNGKTLITTATLDKQLVTDYWT
ncbi:MAG: hypothetical protein RI909_884, partial [Bacteroidota bacterium]